MTRPKVAVITRTKDRPVFLQRAMQSVLNQKFPDWVHVIVNDGGDPAPVEMLVEVNRSAYGKRVKVVHHTESRGMQNASNAGLEAVDSTYAVIHDDDDSWYPDFLSNTVAFLESEGPDSLVQGVVTQTTQVLEEITLSGTIQEHSRRPYYPFAFINLGELRRRNLFPPIAFLYRRKVHETTGLFRQEFDVLGDHDFNLRFVRHFEIGVIPTFHAYYHWRHGSYGNTVTRNREVHRQMLNRMKNAYYREALEHPETAVGDLEGVDFPDRDGTDPVPFRLRTSESKPPRPLPDFQKEFQFKVLSLDVFDTVLKRRCHHPSDIFKFVEEGAVKELGLPEQPYALARAQAEHLARKEVRPEISPEVTLEEIYQYVARLCGLKEKQAKDLMALELATERRFLYGDPRWVDLYARLRSSGQRVIFVSDMYLESATIRPLLADCGFADAEVYVSCELHASKHEGSLQGKVAALVGVEPGDILHVGDNFHSDYLETIHAGWQAFYWSSEYSYIPWYAEVDPFVHNRHDLLSSRIMGEVSRQGLVEGGSPGDLIFKLGRELAGPFYLSYLMWVLEQAGRDGVRKLLLIGRDGFYWEKTLQLIAEKAAISVEFAYLHASRKVFNFASYYTLDDTAIEFLSTPNPALRVRDFIDRTGLDSSQYLDHIRMAGFGDPGEVLTNEMGGRFLEDYYPRQLEQLFRLLKPDLEALFAEDRAGTLKVLEEAGYDHQTCAFVDIGWNGSCIRPIGRLLGLREPGQVKAYFFGTWKEATRDSEHVSIKSFFMHLNEPLDHFQLIRESVNLLESLNAAPFPTLMAFHTEGEDVVPKFASHLKSGFSIEDQERLWQGARSFLSTILADGLPETGEKAGHCYLFLVLNRLLREPSPAEVKTWGSILHSDGFGIEVYKRLVEPVDEKMTGPELMSAYMGSNWKRGFLASLPQNQRQFVLERIEKRAPRTFEQLKADLDYKVRQADELWGEKEQYKWRAGHLQETVTSLQKSLDKLQGDLTWKNQQTEEIWAEKERLQQTANGLQETIAGLHETVASLHETIAGMDKTITGLQETIAGLQEDNTGLKAHVDKLQGDLNWKNQQTEEIWAEKERHRGEAEGARLQVDALGRERDALKEMIDALSAKAAWLEAEIATCRSTLAETEAQRLHLEGVLKDRGKLLRVLFSGRIPPR